VNEAKGDKDPAQWMPQLAHCKYIEQWVAVKLCWHLSADRAEKAALRRFASGCPNPLITVSLARIGFGGSGGGGSTNCSPAYPSVCIPPPSPDLDCSDISYRNFTVLPPDPHHYR